MLDWKETKQAKSSWTFLPVTWWMNGVRQQVREHHKEIRAVPEVQDFLDGLPPGRYVTVARGDDGPYERLPRETIVFGADCGDIPVPLLPPEAR